MNEAEYDLVRTLWAIVKWVFTLVYVFPFSLTVLIPLSALFVLTAPWRTPGGEHHRGGMN